MKVFQKIFLSELKKELEGCTFSSSVDDVYFEHIIQINEKQVHGISWLNPSRKDKTELYKNATADILICAKEDTLKENKSIKFHIYHPNPKLIFTRIVNYIFNKENDENYKGENIHATAVIHPKAVVHPSVKVGAFSTIGICEIGEGSVIKNNVVIGDKVKIGKNVVIYNYCNVGSEGFGFARNEDNTLIRMEHLGSVFIEDNVEIFPFSNIDRATLTETRVKKGTKLDHYSHIGHNCLVGENCIITANVTLCGGVTIGDNCWIGVNSVIKEAVKIGKGATVGLGSVVTKNIPDNETWFGVPAKPKQ